MKRTILFAAALLTTLQLLAEDKPLRPKIAGVAHIALYSHDVEKSRAFYKTFLGYQEPFSVTNDDGSLRLTFFKINDRQYIELFPEKEAGSDRLNHISIETDDVEKMRTYLASRGIKVPDKANTGRIGNLHYTISDPDGHQVEIVQYAPDSLSARARGKFMSDERISTRLMHLGIIVTNLESSLKFYHDILGFQEFWRGSRDTNKLSWVNLKVPDGDDYVELMLHSELPPPDKRGTAHHLCLEVADVEKAKAIAEKRAPQIGYTRAMQTQTGVNRKRQMNLYDPDGTRVELMEWKTVEAK